MSVLVPKDNGEFRGFVLVAILWKTMLGIINRRVGTVFRFHYKLHWFCKGWGSGDAYLESKMLQQVMLVREDIPYDVLPNLQKYYEALNIERYI